MVRLKIPSAAFSGNYIGKINGTLGPVSVFDYFRFISPKALKICNASLSRFNPISPEINNRRREPPEYAAIAEVGIVLRFVPKI